MHMHSLNRLILPFREEEVLYQIISPSFAIKSIYFYFN